ncbi:MAG: HupE/UreJ family protein, partial [Proteobacteria bacterium]|nr:HupE/UreJ family protein [Pseudomonadota bacterium]
MAIPGRPRGRGDARIGFALAAALALTLICDAATAHQRSVSYSRLELESDRVRVTFRVSLLELTRLPWIELPPAQRQFRIAQYLSETLTLRAAGTACPVVVPPAPLPAAEGFARFTWIANCGTASTLRLESRAFLEVAPSHLHFARWASGDGSVRERLLSEQEPAWELPLTGEAAEAGPAPEGSSFASYALLGVVHILAGFDHLAFVLALLLLARSLAEVAMLVTGFTVAHSLTLAAAVLGVVRPESGAVEALIGFSIALVAAENAWRFGGEPRALPRLLALGLTGMALASWTFGWALSPATALGLALFAACYFAAVSRAERKGRLRFAISFAFGLIHGFGFAGVLSSLELPAARLVPALAGFNLGVELGQLAVVALAWPLLNALGRTAGGPRLVAAFN